MLMFYTGLGKSDDVPEKNPLNVYENRLDDQFLRILSLWPMNDFQKSLVRQYYRGINSTGMGLRSVRLVWDVCWVMKPYCTHPSSAHHR